MEIHVLQEIQTTHSHFQVQMILRLKLLQQIEECSSDEMETDTLSNQQNFLQEIILLLHSIHLVAMSESEPLTQATNLM